MSQLQILHLLDDTTAGGVVRTVNYMVTHPALSKNANHETVQTRKGAWSAESYSADIIISHTTLSWHGLLGLISLRAKNPKARLIHVEHSYTRAFTKENVRHKSRFLRMLRIGYALFDDIVAVSENQAEWLLENGLAKQDALHVISPMVDVAPFEAIRNMLAKGKVIGAIGRLERQKGFDILIDGFRAWDDPDARLRIYGEGSERSALEKLASGDARISFEGHASDPATAMAEMSVLAMPSRWEAYGLVALEAQAAGRMVVSSNVDGLNDPYRSIVLKTNDDTAYDWAKALGQCFKERSAKGVYETISIERFKETWVSRWAILLFAKSGEVY